MLHEVAAAAVRRHRQSAADHLAERREVGGDAEALARAAERDAESGHHLVEDQQGAGCVGEPPQAREGTPDPAG